MYLVIRRSCKKSRTLLVWIKDNRCRLHPGILEGLRVLDVDSMACKGIARRVNQVPCLVLRTKTQPIIAGNKAVAAYLLSGRVNAAPAPPAPPARYAVQGRPKMARARPTRASASTHTQRGRRDEKKKRFDSDMEALLAQRKALGYETPTRV